MLLALREGELVSHDVVTSKSWETKERNSLPECLESSTALPDFKVVGEHLKTSILIFISSFGCAGS